MVSYENQWLKKRMAVLNLNKRDGMKGSRKLSRKVHSFLIQYFLLRVYCISLRQELLIQNRKVQHSLNLRDAKFFPSGEPTNSPFIERFCRRQKD